MPWDSGNLFPRNGQHPQPDAIMNACLEKWKNNLYLCRQIPERGIWILLSSAAKGRVQIIIDFSR